MIPPPLPKSVVTQRRPRSVVVKVLGLLFLVIGTLGLPVSVISMLMLLAGSYGTQSFDFIGFCTVVLGPSCLLAVGIGLLWRLR